mgnify:CR=1 FL=1
MAAMELCAFEIDCSQDRILNIETQSWVIFCFRALYEQPKCIRFLSINKIFLINRDGNIFVVEIFHFDPPLYFVDFKCVDDSATRT